MKAIIIFLLAFTVMSCSDDKSANNTLLGDEKWHLLDVSCECEPLLLEKGQYTFDFNLDNMTVTIVNNTNDDSDLLFPSGKYDIVKDDETLTINNILYYYSIKEDILILDENGASALDAPLYRFEKD